jgi:very-short-patch-repair endonuclease
MPVRHYPHYLVGLSRTLRGNSTDAEVVLWKFLRRHNFGGLKFKRQHPIGRYIVDFYCRELALVVELEGSIHDTNDQMEYDAERFQELEARGLRIMRIPNSEVFDNVQDVLKKIESVSELPSPESGEGMPPCPPSRRAKAEGRG